VRGGKARHEQHETETHGLRTPKKKTHLTFRSLLHQPAWILIQNLDETALGQVTKTATGFVSA
jgi:hypothetical protein